MTDFQEDFGYSIEPIPNLEYLIGNAGADLAPVRTALRTWLFDKAGLAGQEGSTADALSAVAQNGPNRDAAIVTLRCLAVQTLIPAPTAANQIVRSVTALCEGSVPDLCEYLRVDRKAQNFEKFGALSSFHHRIEELLRPLADQHGDLDGLLNSRKDILGVLNHSVVKAYGAPYRLGDIRNAIEAVFSRLKRVSSLEASFLQDYEECERSIEDARNVANENRSFFARDYLVPFLDNTSVILGSYLRTVRSRFFTTVTKGGLPGPQLQKNYPLYEAGREVRVAIPLRNEGPGLATDVRVTAAVMGEAVYIASQSVALGNVLPGDFAVVLDTMVVEPTHAVDGILQVEWGELGDPVRKSEAFEFRIASQSADIDWSSLSYWTPYSTDVAEGEHFIGRTEKVELLAAKLLRSPMEPFYVTGQKRIGKTSLALAAAQFALERSPENTLLVDYILWGDVAHAEPRSCLRQLGERIATFIRKHIPEDQLPPQGDYDGSLAPLLELSDIAILNHPKRKFVIIIDEFDEIPQELFIHGNLAETFFANLRSISRRKNICLCLVGGENMPFIMDRQGQKLNNFSRVNLSYFSRDTEWSDFQLMIRKPSEGVLSWHEDAISEVFNATNGNPYYAKIVCAGVVRRAVSERDADITAVEVKAATEAEVSVLGTNSFAHLWQDGVPKAADEREPDVLRRSRVLVAAARCLREPVALTASNIAERKVSLALSEAEIPAVLNDFLRRDVMRENGGEYEIILPIFGRWLADVGANQLVADSLSDELAQSVIEQENAVMVRSDEVVALSKSWPTYRGRQIGTDDIRAWYQQVASPREQRILFELLKKTSVLSETHVRERLRAAHNVIRTSLPVPITRKKNERRTDIVVTYVDGPGKSGANYASLYAEENGLAANSVLAPAGFHKSFEKYKKGVETVSAVIMIDDIAATGQSLAANFADFISENTESLASVKVRAMTLVATAEAQERILRSLSKIDTTDVDFRACEILGATAFAFPDDKSGWGTEDGWERARALCIQLGTKIYRQSPLGFGGQGLLIVFPTTTPNNSLPILHSHSRAGTGAPWSPIFPRVAH